LALDKQIHIHSVDTNAFYQPEERIFYLKLLQYRENRRKLQEIDKKVLNEIQLKVYKKMYKNITKGLNKSKQELKDKLKQNTEIRKLDMSCLVDKSIISVFESTLTRTANLKINELTKDIIVVQTYYYDIIEQIIKNGFMFNKEKYIYFTSSAGQIRTKKTVFIKEKVWNKYKDSIMCGLTIEKINELGGVNVNKFLAYLALTNSATDEWKEFDIDKCIVVKDFETKVESEVDFIDDITFNIERKTMKIPITHTDGCGMILPKLSKANFMIRLPWLKGLLASFDFVKFIKTNNCSPIVKDIYDKEWNIIDDDIQVIFTESQFKMWKFYKDWEDYKNNFKKHNCQAGVCNKETDYFNNATINYQMLQTLTDISKDEITELLRLSQETLNNLTKDKNTMLRVFGVTKSNINKTHLQQALEIYPELLQDEHCKKVLRQIKNSLVKEYKAGKLEVNGKYTFFIPDLYAFCEWLFLKIDNPSGLLKNGQVHCKLFVDSNKLDCLRSPHLYREHAVRENAIDEEKNNWFKTKAVYTSCKDPISKILQFDNDGDMSLVVADKIFVNIAERNMKNDDIVPLYYEMKKAQPIYLDMNNIYNGLNAAYSGGNIGEISNSITKIWNREHIGEDELKAIKILCAMNNFVIDYAKTLYKPKYTEEIEIIMKKYSKPKLPHFFIYAKDKKLDQVEKATNNLVDSFYKEIKSPTLRFNIKNFGKLIHSNLMNNKNIKIDEQVIKKYDKLNKEYHFKIEQKNKSNIGKIILDIKNELMQFGYSDIEITDMLIKYLFIDKKTPNKEILWQCFGDVLVSNLKNNIPLGSVQCQNCGKRFMPTGRNHNYCNICSEIIKKENARLRKRKQRSTKV